MGEAIEALLLELLDERKKELDLPILATRFLTIRLDDAAATLFRMLQKHPSEAAIRGILPLLVELARRDDRWERVVRKSATKRGRCPTRFKPELRQALREPSKALARGNRKSRIQEPTEEIKPTKADKIEIRKRFGRRARLPVTVKSTNIGHIELLIDALDKLVGESEIDLDFGGTDHVYITGLAILAAWSADRVKINVKNSSPATEEYLQRIGFLRLVRGDLPGAQRAQIDRLREHPTHVALVPIAGNPTEQVAAEITRVCDEWGILGRQDRSALAILFAELLENIARHSGATNGSYVSAQYYPARKKLTIAIVDRGMGIKDSFLRGTNQDVIERIRRGESPLDLAVAPLITSKPVRNPGEPGHAGYGLYVASELTIRNGGTFRLTSGTESVMLSRRHQDSWRRQRVRVQHSEWRGTIVAILLDLDQLLPIGEVYGSLPMPEGFEREDFFFDG